MNLLTVKSNLITNVNVAQLMLCRVLHMVCRVWVILNRQSDFSN